MGDVSNILYAINIGYNYIYRYIVYMIEVSSLHRHKCEKA